MTARSRFHGSGPLALAVLLAVGLVTLVAGSAAAGGYVRADLVSDLPGAARTDTNLVNAWGIGIVPGGPFWVADNGTGVVTIYRSNDLPVPSPRAPLIVTVPPPPGGMGPAAPTGIVFNDTSAFALAPGKPAHFLFATEDGTISGWNPDVSMTNAVLEVNRSPDAVYKGLTRLGSQLFATNFRANSVDVFNGDFSLAGSFTDTTVPAGFAPFGIANLNGAIFVTFAMQNDARHDDVKGPGNGYVDIFDPNAHTFTRLISGGTASSPLNSPWGLALAPGNFGPLGGDLLIGNFGDGHINAFRVGTGAFDGPLKDPSGNPVVIDGLWGLAFGADPLEPRHPFLFFTAGIQDEAHGLFGRIDYVSRRFVGHHLG